MHTDNYTVSYNQKALLHYSIIGGGGGEKNPTFLKHTLKKKNPFI